MNRLSLIVSVLESYEVLRRQLLNLGRILPRDCELILVDDGSVPPLQEVWDGVEKPPDFILHRTDDRRPWTQPRARNLGAALARSDRLVFFDIDHILTESVLEECGQYGGDKLHWIRRPGILDREGHVVTEREILIDYGLTDDRPSVHGNSFLIRRVLFNRLGGYDERFCGRYGGDDIDFNARYERLCAEGVARPAEVRGLGYVYPDPARDRQGLFHSLPREFLNNSPASASVVARSPDLVTRPTGGFPFPVPQETFGPADGGVRRPAPNIDPARS